MKVPLAHGREKSCWFMNSSQCRELDRIEKEPMEVERRIHNIADSRRNPEYSVNRSNFQKELSSSQCTTTLYGVNKETKDCLLRIPKNVADVQEDSRTDIGCFLGLNHQKMVRNSHVQRNGKWDRVAEDVMLNFSESGHPVFRGSTGLERGDLKMQTKRKLS